MQGVACTCARTAQKGVCTHVYPVHQLHPTHEHCTGLPAEDARVLHLDFFLNFKSWQFVNVMHERGSTSKHELIKLQ